MALFALLGQSGIPTFYDKLLAVPILNLMIQVIDRAVRSPLLRRVDPGAWLRRLSPGRRNLAYMAVWTVLFATMQSRTESQIALVRANIMLEDGRVAESIEHYRALLEDVPDHPAAHANLGLTLMRVGETAAGVRSLRRVVEMDPHDAVARHNLATALYATGNPTAAVEEFEEALRARPDSPRSLAAVAWIQATDPQERDPEAALRLALRAAELTGHRDIAALDSLAAAYASLGRFELATQTARAAEALALRSNPGAADAIRSRLALYRAGRPFVIGRP